MLMQFESYRSVWVETTSSENDHGGPGWQFGSFLWSPTTNSSGHDRYAIMRRVEPGDCIIHVLKDRWEGRTLDRRICGHSLAAAAAEVTNDPPPTPGKWSNRPSYYRIPLRDYEGFPASISTEDFTSSYLEELLVDAENHRNQRYPFPGFKDGVRLPAGIYLTRCTASLFDLIVEATAIEVAKNEVAPSGRHEQREFGEVKRQARERYFFARNPALAAAVKERDRFTCQICKFNFEASYGELGRGYAECHHLDPLSERPEARWSVELRTDIERAITLCANCHRVVHRVRPARSVEIVRANYNAS